MYGMVNRAVEDLVVSSAGEEAWRTICAEAGIEVEYFEAMEPYDDSITYDLVAAASTVLDTPAEEILESFGRHWILYTGAEGWGPVLDSQGSTVAEVIGNLNQMHIRIQATMPSLVMPTFNIISTSAERIEFEYHSHREGLAPMVLGLVKGLTERCGEEWDVAHTGLRSVDGHDTFALTARSRSAATVTS